MLSAINFIRLVREIPGLITGNPLLKLLVMNE